MCWRWCTGLLQWLPRGACSATKLSQRKQRPTLICWHGCHRVPALQHRANVVVVECMPADQAVWQQRLEARAALEAAADSSHKPKTWQQLEALIARCRPE